MELLKTDVYPTVQLIYIPKTNIFPNLAFIGLYFLLKLLYSDKRKNVV